MKNRVVLRIARFYDNEQPLPMLEDVGLAQIKAGVFHCTGHDIGNTGRYIYKEISSDAEKLSEVLNSELGHNLIVRTGTRPTEKDLRLVISRDALSIDQTVINQDNLVLLSFDEDTHGWTMDQTTCCPVRLTLSNQSPSILRNVISDIMLDIYLANSLPIWPIVRNAIKAKGREWLYKQKVDFVTSDYGNETAYGGIGNNCGYIPFSSVARLENHRVYERAVAMWDSFIFKRLKEFILSPEAIASDLRHRRLIGGQLKKEEILSSIIEELENGAWLLIFTNKYKGIEAVLRSNPNLPAPRHGKISFLRSEQVDKGLQDMLREQKLFALKFYKG